MTIIQPNKNQHLLHQALVVLIIGAMCSALILVVLYNRYINLTHNISEIGSKIQRVETENAEFKEKIFELFSSEHLQAFAQERQLVKDRTPHYVRVD